MLESHTHGGDSAEAARPAAAAGGPFMGGPFTGSLCDAAGEDRFNQNDGLIYKSTNTLIRI